MTHPPDGTSSMQAVRDLFLQAWERAAYEREAFVAGAAASDAALLQQVVALLHAASADGTKPEPGAAREWIAKHLAAAAPAPAGGERVQATATEELLQKLAAAPKLDTNRYELQGEVDRGGMGAILRIHDRQLNRRLAMKMLLERPAPRNDEEQQLAHQVLGRFLEEAQVTSQLDHPGVVPVHELGLDQTGKVYFTMRLVKGRTAGDIFELVHRQQEDWTTTRALEVVLKVCDTMSYAHSKGVLHRDLKPGNVMVGAFGEVYVMDWGLAKVTDQADRHDLRIRKEGASSVSRLDTVRKRDAEGDSGSSVVSMDGQKLGTPSYMAPEQARSEAVDQRADVYSIGAMMYELLTGLPPYVVPGLRQPAYRLLEKVVEAAPRPIEQGTKGVPAELVAIVEKAMARDRGRRFASTAELAADLRAFLDHRAVKAYRTGALVELQLWVRRNRPLAAALVAAMLILVAGIAGTTVYAKRASENETLANTRADENAKLAREKSALATAESNAKEDAMREKGRADAKVREFDQLKGVVLYERAIANEKELYPALPSKVEAMETWLREDAGKLLAMKEGIEKTVRDLEGRALPPTAEELEADRRSHPRFAEFELLGIRVASLRYAHSIREGKAQLVVPDLTAAQQALDAKALNSLAWPRVAPPAKAGKAEERTIYGEEALGLACSRAAVAKAYATDGEYQVLDTLAWALLANGQDAEAKAKSAEALGNAPDNEYETYVGFQRDLDAAVTKAAEILAATEQQLADLGKAVNVRRTFRFELEAQRFLHDTLAELLGKLGSLEAKEKADVEKRLSWAKQIEGLSMAHPKARHTWAAVRAAIAGNAKYAGQKIELRDQDITGLVPIGENPVTKLWEFYELRSAWDGKADPLTIAIPSHEPDGSIRVNAATGIVFVLLPGGTFTMGAQKDDTYKPNYDAQAQADETAHEVTLAPFFLARHELTQGQWARLWTWDPGLRQPSQYKAGQTIAGQQITRRNPVEQVDWTMCDTLLKRHGLVLPTEAQWEYGCRAGTSTPWLCTLDELQRFANVADASAKSAGVTWTCEAWSDEHLVHAPVGSFAANAFGLYDVHGNVWEWCRDRYGSYSGPVHEGDGLRLGGDSSAERCARGGGFDLPAASARSAYRFGDASSSFRVGDLGLRCARTLRLPD
jgi:formylglycine-generating enzyme required for sulfatase activity/serine/threonine protein kinase